MLEASISSGDWVLLFVMKPTARGTTQGLTEVITFQLKVYIVCISKLHYILINLLVFFYLTLLSVNDRSITLVFIDARLIVSNSLTFCRLDKPIEKISHVMYTFSCNSLINLMITLQECWIINWLILLCRLAKYQKWEQEVSEYTNFRVVLHPWR